MATDTLCKLIEGKGKTLNKERSSWSQSPRGVKPPMLIVQYRVTKANILQAGYKI